MAARPGVAVLGTGRMGLALAHSLARADEIGPVTVFGRRPEAPPHAVLFQGEADYVFGLRPLDRDVGAVFLAISDHAVPEMARSLAHQGPAPEGCCAFLVSSTLPTAVLGGLHQAGYAVGSFHPLVALPEVGGPDDDADPFWGSFVAASGSPSTVATASALARALGADVLTLPEGRRPLYDAAVTMAGDYLAPLLDHAARLMERAGVSSEDALHSLVPLVRATLAKIEKGGVEQGAYGPIAQGDVETVALHLRALDPEDRQLYSLLGLEVLRLASDRLSPAARDQMGDLLARSLEPETAGRSF